MIWVDLKDARDIKHYKIKNHEAVSKGVSHKAPKNTKQ